MASAKRGAVTVPIGLIALAAGIALGTFDMPSSAPVVVVGAVAAAAMISMIGTQRGLDQVLTFLMGMGALLTPMNGLRAGSWMAVGDTFFLMAIPLIVGRRLFMRQQDTSAFRPVYVAVLLILLGGLISSFLSDVSPLGALPDLARFAISTFGVLSLIAAWGPARSQLRILLWLYTIGACISVIAGMVMGFNFAGRAVGLSLHPNHLGMVSMLASGVAFGLATSSTGRMRKFALTLCVVLLAGVAISGSRAALVGEIVMILTLMVAIRLWYAVRLVVVVAIIFVVTGLVGIVPLPTANSVQRLLGDETTQISDTERDSVRAASLEEVRKNPVMGSGFQFARAAHSLYLQIWVSSGITGLIGVILLMIVVVRLIVVPRTPSNSVVSGMAAAFGGFLFAGIASNILWDRYVWLHLAMAIGFVSSSREVWSPLPPTTMASVDQRK